MAKSWQSFRQNWVAILGLLFLAFCGFQFVRFIYGPLWFARLESKARGNIKPEALQNWAANLIARSPSDAVTTFTARELGADFPEELRRLSPQDPTVIVYHMPAPDDSSFVEVKWRAGAVYGERGVHIGPASFAAKEHVQLWHTNLYFFRRR
jgi:hypothetical protein